MFKGSEAMKIRRRIALISFFSILITLFSCLGIAFVGSTLSATTLNSLIGIITPIMIFLTAIVTQYQYQCHKPQEGSVDDSCDT